MFYSQLEKGLCDASELLPDELAFIGDSFHEQKKRALGETDLRLVPSLTLPVSSSILTEPTSASCLNVPSVGIVLYPYPSFEQTMPRSRVWLLTK
jgi:hypothetical protein